MINDSEILTGEFIYTDYVKHIVTDEDLHSKLRQVKEVTNCNEEQGILILHDCNYNVEYAINKILTLTSHGDFEWQTKKGKQKKIQLKIKQIEKDDLNNNLKDSVNNKLLKDEFNQDSYNNGKTFRNFNLSKIKTSECSINENLKYKHKTSIMDFNCKWDGKSIIIQNLDISPMLSADISTISEVKDKVAQKEMITQDNIIMKEDDSIESSIMFKTHCSTKPPPKVQYSLSTPVQIMNKNISHRSMPKLKFGDTDFSDNSHFESLGGMKIASYNKNPILQPTVINVEDNSIIKVGPSQKVFIDQSLPNFETFNIYNPNSYLTQKSVTSSSMSNNNKNIDFQKCNLADPYIENFGYINIQNQLPVENSLSCNPGFQSLGPYASSNMTSINDIGNLSKTSDVFINQHHSNTYQSQSNINHPKSTIYIVPNMMMNPMNALYMTVANPLPTSALSPPMAPIQAQYNVPQLHQSTTQHHNQLYFDDSQNQNEDASNRVKRQFNQSRQQLPINRTKKCYGDLSEDLSVMKLNDTARSNFKGLPNFPQSQLPKQVSINYPVFINGPQNRSQLITNALNSLPVNYHSQETGSYDSNSKRTMPIQSNNFCGKSWS